MLAAVKAVRVAAPSSGERRSTSSSGKALRSSDFGGGAAEVGMPQILRHVVVVHAPLGRQGAVLVARQAAALLHPVVDHGVAGAGIECQQLAGAPDPGDVRNAADIEDGDRPLRQPGRKCAVVDGSERGALSAGGAVRRPQVVDHVDADAARQKGAIAELDRHALLGRMPDGVAVKADHIDVGRLQALLRQELPDRGGVALGQLALDLGEAARAVRAVGQIAGIGDGTLQR